MIRKIKEAIGKMKRKNTPVVFLSFFSYEPIPLSNFAKLREMLAKFGKENNVEFAIISNSLVRPIERKELKQLFDYVYKSKVNDGNRRNDIQIL